MHNMAYYLIMYMMVASSVGLKIATSSLILCKGGHVGGVMFGHGAFEKLTFQMIHGFFCKMI